MVEDRALNKSKIFVVLKDIIRIMCSNIVSLMSGVALGFLLPKLLSVTDYGYYKTFNLYVAYIGIFTFGITDGIVLLFGGKDYDNLNKKFFRSVFKIFLFIEICCSCIIACLGFAFTDLSLQFIFIALGINLLAQNIVNYFQQISQITQRFKEYSNRNFIISILNISSVIFLYILKMANVFYDYRIYICLVLLIQYILMIWYIYTYRSIVFGKCLTIISTLKSVKYFVWIGFPLLVANLCSTLMLTIDRQFVNVFFDTDTYAVYAFAYNMLSLVTVATSAISVVLYPLMKRTSNEKLTSNYNIFIMIMLIFTNFAIASYFPLCSFINWFLPEYSASLFIFRIIFPGLTISTTITVVMHNYYKTMNANNLFFKKSIIVLGVSVLANLIAFYVYGTTSAISIASIITMLFWYIYVEDFFKSRLKIDTKRNFVYMLLMIALFYIITIIKTMWIGFLLYILAYSLFTLLFYFKDIKKIKRMIRN